MTSQRNHKRIRPKKKKASAYTEGQIAKLINEIVNTETELDVGSGETNLVEDDIQETEEDITELPEDIKQDALDEEFSREAVEDEDATIEPEIYSGDYTEEEAQTEDDFISQLPPNMDAAFDIVVEAVFDTELDGDLSTKVEER